MIKIGNPPYLECSSKGDKRFSAFFAHIDSLSNTIEREYQAAKIFKRKLTEEEILKYTKNHPGGINLSYFNTWESHSYTKKDIQKFCHCNKLISQGSDRSSSEKYAKYLQDTYPDRINCGEYYQNDLVGVSAEGNRRGRVAPDFDEINKVIKAKAGIITDIPKDRDRYYNLGEREVAQYLFEHEYIEIEDGLWIPEFVYESGLSWKQAKGRRPLNIDYVVKLYKRLWRMYLLENPSLISVLKSASGLSDIFGQPGRQCQATTLWELRNEL